MASESLRQINVSLPRELVSMVANQLLDDAYLRRLHQDMFGEAWSWAGQYRMRDTNIGVPFEQVSTAVRSLVLDAQMRVDSDVYLPDELSLRFHHRLVATHAFSNGNGRHARIAADYLVAALDAERFSWGANLSGSTNDLRSRYVSALRSADDGDLSELVRFARS